MFLNPWDLNLPELHVLELVSSDPGWASCSWTREIWSCLSFMFWNPWDLILAELHVLEHVRSDRVWALCSWAREIWSWLSFILLNPGDLILSELHVLEPVKSDTGLASCSWTRGIWSYLSFSRQMFSSKFMSFLFEPLDWIISQKSELNQQILNSIISLEP